ncbi:hypothetical protein L3i22_008650 [Actinoplanes sp. L3-i22]|nr:hypothetical protein L3i22_008650 [Actinoplanes sp. L3-i22]
MGLGSGVRWATSGGGVLDRGDCGRTGAPSGRLGSTGGRERGGVGSGAGPKRAEAGAPSIGSPRPRGRALRTGVSADRRGGDAGFSTARCTGGVFPAAGRAPAGSAARLLDAASRPEVA